MKMSRLKLAVRQFETFLISEELRKHDGNICKTAEALGEHRNNINRAIKHLGIDVEEIKRELKNGHKEEM